MKDTSEQQQTQEVNTTAQNGRTDRQNGYGERNTADHSEGARRWRLVGWRKLTLAPQLTVTKYLQRLQWRGPDPASSAHFTPSRTSLRTSLFQASQALVSVRVITKSNLLAASPSPGEYSFISPPRTFLSFLVIMTPFYLLHPGSASLLR